MAKKPKVPDFSVTDTVDLYRLFDVIGLRTGIGVPIIRTFLKWIKASGPEWTVSRLKQLKALYLQHYGGNTEFRLEPSSGISCHSDGSPKGVFHALWTTETSGGSVEASINAMLIYTGVLMTGSPTKLQLKKFYDAVTNPRPAKIETPWRISCQYKYKACRLWLRADYDSLDKWTNSENKVVHLNIEPPRNVFLPHKDRKKYPRGRPVLLRKASLLSVQENSIALEAHRTDALMLSPHVIFEFLPLVNTALGKHRYEDHVVDNYIRLDSQLQVISDRKHLSALGGETPVVGKIGFIQERGCKLRAVANPLRVHQVVLSKLYNWLSLLARMAPYDCSYEQEKGILWAQEKMALGTKLYAYDLSNASDTIPLADQLEYLRLIGPDDDEFHQTLRYFERVSRGNWIYRPTKDYLPGSTLSWVKGQGLGLICSFLCFALTHGARVHQITRNKGLTDQFVVLGDDIIVTEAIAEDYLEFITSEWGCDIAKEKSLSSYSLTEFASRITRRDRTLRSYKYPNNHNRLFSTRDPLSLLRKYGKRGLKLVPSRFRLYVRVLATLPKPHGLGWIENQSVVDYALPDPRDYIQDIVPDKRDKTADVAFTLKLRRMKPSNSIINTRGARYDSIELYSRRSVDRELDIRVAYPSFEDTASIHHSRWARNPGGATVSQPEAQWAVEHLNANRDNTNLDPELITVLTPDQESSVAPVRLNLYTDPGVEASFLRRLVVRIDLLLSSIYEDFVGLTSKVIDRKLSKKIESIEKAAKRKNRILNELNRIWFLPRRWWRKE